MEKRLWTREQIAEVVAQAHQFGHTYKEAVQPFSIPLWRIYRFNCSGNGSASGHDSERALPEALERTKPDSACS